MTSAYIYFFNGDNIIKIVKALRVNMQIISCNFTKAVITDACFGYLSLIHYLVPVIKVNV